MLGFFLYSKLSIGDNVEIGSGLTVHTSEHAFSDTARPLSKQGAEHKPVTIGNDVYMGSSVTVLSGVTIGDRCVIGAGAVVTKDLESGYVYVGVPARKLKPLPQR